MNTVLSGFTFCGLDLVPKTAPVLARAFLRTAHLHRMTLHTLSWRVPVASASTVVILTKHGSRSLSIYIKPTLKSPTELSFRPLRRTLSRLYHCLGCLFEGSGCCAGCCSIADSLTGSMLRYPMACIETFVQLQNGLDVGSHQALCCILAHARVLSG